MDPNLRRDAEAYREKIVYSARYSDDVWEYRHVTVPRELVKYIPKDRLMSEQEWRELGVQQSLGWEHYMIHNPEPQVLLFRREKDYQIKYPTGKPEDTVRYQAATARMGF
ncbi:Cyclin-dependent kinases regulatory subunit 2 [Blastocladiella emersonii ATCC 22665]|nr:Cyclin-dependent kinases regulatory subunit 2 [Blastocladiella emersonii ATCC 22665]